ncbi:shikimate dehydrogenase [Geobacter sp. AOG1]|uniref:shikimate dehydrogenase n=1 Tax=Geobacter sp. AOG1 TaxID=1566346 RepID=UPI001CC45851|nr:shikimate dehydrogenase [Geobacter sp. AOG1]GFE58456.1 shikimate dehydrogenase (NADP(+)) [Geobacter sp. AOG1]
MRVDIQGKTRVLGIIGWPVAHSLSPLMQNAACIELGLDYVYVPFPVAPGDLPKAVEGLRALGVAGFNVTIPHKEAIIGLLDELSEEARLIGAVNTVKRDGDRLIGHNTDITGLIKSLQDDLGFDVKGSRVVLLGAGGAARAALVGLCQSGAASVTVANRTPAKGECLVAGFRSVFTGVNLALCTLDILKGDRCLKDVDLLINTTAVGLNGTNFTDLDLAPMAPAARVYDMVYNPALTPLLVEARKHSLRSANGAGMLAAQGEAAFTIWTGCKPPNGLMKSRLLAALDGQDMLDNGVYSK